MKKKEIEQEIESIKNRLTDLQSQLEDRPKTEIGRWYWAEKERVNFLYCYQGSKSYGFDWSGNWASDLCTGGFNMIEATPQEVETALIKEAKKRGFKYDSTINSFFCGTSTASNCTDYEGLILDGSKEFWIYGLCVFKDGKWAEIIDTPLEINGHPMKQEGDIITFGCAKFHKNWLKDLYRFSTLDMLTGYDLSWTVGNRKIKSITLDSGVEISIEKLKEIVDNIK